MSGKTVGAEKVWTGEAHVASGTASAIHHHGDSETGINVVAGRPAIATARSDEGRRRLTLRPV